MWKILTSLLLLGILISPALVEAFVDPTCWIVSGAGTTAVNGTYTLFTTNSNSLNGNGQFGSLNDAAYALSGGTGPALVVTALNSGGTSYNATELLPLSGGILTSSSGYYYTQSVAAQSAHTNYALIDTKNANGTLPIPTITACAAAGVAPFIKALVSLWGWW